MLKVTVSLLAVALASTASAGGWRSLRFDATSEAAFEKSVALFRDELSPSRQHAFERALQEIWTQQTHTASAEQRDFTREDYLELLDGRAYDDIVKLPDPTGTKAKRYRAEYYDAQAYRYRGWGIPGSAVSTPWPSPTGGPPPVQNGEYRGASRSIDYQTH